MYEMTTSSSGSGCMFSSQASIHHTTNYPASDSTPPNESQYSDRLDAPSTSCYPPNYSPLPIPALIKRQIYADGLSYEESIDDFDADKFSRDLFVSSDLIRPPLLGDSEGTSSLFPICRICHQPGDDGNNLISPCRCTGSLQYIHGSCLKKWLEVSSKKSRKPPKCELCRFQYNRHKKFKFRHVRLPRISYRDRVLHCVFIVNLLIMIACAVATVLCFLSDRGRLNVEPDPEKTIEKVDLAPDEIITLTCGVVFFVSFFVAMTVQIKAKHTMYQLCAKMVMQNMEWEIDEYDGTKDVLYKNKSDIVCK